MRNGCTASRENKKGKPYGTLKVVTIWKSTTFLEAVLDNEKKWTVASNLKLASVNLLHVPG